MKKNKNTIAPKLDLAKEALYNLELSRDEWGVLNAAVRYFGELTDARKVLAEQDGELPSGLLEAAITHLGTINEKLDSIGSRIAATHRRANEAAKTAEALARWTAVRLRRIQSEGGEE